jgi:hypothetical protein
VGDEKRDAWITVETCVFARLPDDTAMLAGPLPGRSYAKAILVRLRSRSHVAMVTLSRFQASPLAKAAR